MIEKVVNLKDGTSIYIADVLDYEEKRYVYGLQYDKLTENITGKYYILEVKIIDNKLSLANINDRELKNRLYFLFTSKQFENILNN